MRKHDYRLDDEYDNVVDDIIAVVGLLLIFLTVGASIYYFGG